MPAHFYLHIFGELVRDAFDGAVPYHVGSSLDSKIWRDVDVRLLLDSKEWDRFIGEPYEAGNALPNGSRRRSLEMAYDALGRHITALPIDFQIQQRDKANEQYGGQRRSAIGIRLHTHCEDGLSCPAFTPAESQT